MPPVLDTPSCDTIPLADQPPYPDNMEIESRISALVRWNALAIVVRANKKASELGGHIAAYAPVADLFQVGYNHFFRAGQGGDLVYWQPHAAPGVYARAFLEGRLSEAPRDNCRQETGGKGLSSYCHHRRTICGRSTISFATGCRAATRRRARTALAAATRAWHCDRKLVKQGIDKYGIDASRPNPWDSQAAGLGQRSQAGIVAYRGICSICRRTRSAPGSMRQSTIAKWSSCRGTRYSHG